ncbi:MAG: nucleoside recognition domain-containing protein [Myxococcota bacterium]
MLNGIFFFLIVGSVVVASFTGTMGKLTADSAEAAKNAVTLCIGLIGQMALWLGMMRILREGGLLHAMSRAIGPIFQRLIPSVPPDHPAMAAMVLNMTANMLGLGNAATPFGLKAMRELERLNPSPGVATNAMAMFLAINTSGLAVFPLGVIAVRASLGAKNLAGITIPSILSTFTAAAAGILVAKLLEKQSRFDPARFAEPSTGGEATLMSQASGEHKDAAIKGMEEAEKIAATKPTSRPHALVGWVVIAAILVGLGKTLVGRPEHASAFDAMKSVVSEWLIPMLMLGVLLFGYAKRVKVYETFISGAKEGFDIGISIIPFLVAILVAIAMFRASGAMDFLVHLIGPVTNLIGIPAETLPMAFIRPLSGSGALAVMTDTMKTYGPDSLVGFIVSVMNGSTETTFYVLAVYFGSVGIRATRHTVWACLAADVAGLASAVLYSRIFY